MPASAPRNRKPCCLPHRQRRNSGRDAFDIAQPRRAVPVAKLHRGPIACVSWVMPCRSHWASGPRRRKQEREASRLATLRYGRPTHQLTRAQRPPWQSFAKSPACRPTASALFPGQQYVRRQGRVRACPGLARERSISQPRCAPPSTTPRWLADEATASAAHTSGPGRKRHARPRGWGRRSAMTIVSTRSRG